MPHFLGLVDRWLSPFGALWITLETAVVFDWSEYSDAPRWIKTTSLLIFFGICWLFGEAFVRVMSEVGSILVNGVKAIKEQKDYRRDGGVS